jgi:hypothetical protein
VLPATPPRYAQLPPQSAPPPPYYAPLPPHYAPPTEVPAGAQQLWVPRPSLTSSPTMKKTAAIDFSLDFTFKNI